jgi:tetratricopeptide (TPR) repeat protein
MKRKLQAIAVLLLLGVVKLPVDRQATQHLQKARLLSPPVDLGLRESFGQMSFAAALGGLRSLVASITYLQAYEEWKNTRWAKVDSLFQLTTRLQPRYGRYWDEAAWHMAYNAASSYLYNEELEEGLRAKFYRDHVQRGLNILKEGLRALPDDAQLWNSLAEIYERRVNDPYKAAECYLQAFRVTKNARFARFAGYQYAETKDPALWKKGYDLLKAVYDRGQRQPTLINTLKSLEERLHIPLVQQIPEKAIPVPKNQDGTVPLPPR